MGDGNISFNAVILGNRGNGKSSLGNCILKKKTFAVSQADIASSMEPCYANGNFHNFVLKVADIPDCPVMPKDQLESYRKMISDVFDRREDNLHLFLLVIKFENENCGKNLQVFDKWRQVLGEDVFKKWGIVVVTFGDEFTRSMETRQTPDKTFDDWCLEQRGDLSKLFKECNMRIVLIDSTADQNDHSFQKLFEYMQELPCPYSRNSFMKFTKSQKISQLLGDSTDNISDTQKEFTELRNYISCLQNSPSTEALFVIEQQIKNLKEKTNLTNKEKNTLSALECEVNDTLRKLSTSNATILKNSAMRMSETLSDSSKMSMTQNEVIGACCVFGVVVVLIYLIKKYRKK